MSSSIGNTARTLISTMKGATNQQILDKVLEVHQGAKTTLACIAWYKSDMKKNNVKVVVERNQEQIEQELQVAKDAVVALEEELQNFVESNKEKLIADFEAKKQQMIALGYIQE